MARVVRRSNKGLSTTESTENTEDRTSPVQSLPELSDSIPSRPHDSVPSVFSVVECCQACGHPSSQRRRENAIALVREWGDGDLQDIGGNDGGPGFDLSAEG